MGLYVCKKAELVGLEMQCVVSQSDGKVVDIGINQGGNGWQHRRREVC